MTDESRPSRRVVKMPTNVDENGYPVCPECGCNRSEVTHTYPWKKGKRRRRRECDNCKLTFFTYQTPEQPDT